MDVYNFFMRFELGKGNKFVHFGKDSDHILDRENPELSEMSHCEWSAPLPVLSSS